MMITLSIATKKLDQKCDQNSHFVWAIEYVIFYVVRKLAIDDTLKDSDVILMSQHTEKSYLTMLNANGHRRLLKLKTPRDSIRTDTH